MATRTFEFKFIVKVENDEVTDPENMKISHNELIQALENSVCLDLQIEEGENVFGDNVIAEVEIDWDSIKEV